MQPFYKTSSVHTHTTFCDGKNTPAEMAQAALEQGLKTLGFSGHVHTPPDTSYCMTLEGTQQYCAQVAQLKKEYAGRMDILCGIEYDPLVGEALPVGYDYVIGSVHAVRGRENGKLYAVDMSTEEMQRCIHDGFGGDAMAAVRDYYEQLIKVAQKKPTILGHFDLVVKTNRNGILFDEQSKEYLDIAMQALDACIEQDVCFEMNTGAIWRGWRTEPYPDMRLLHRMAEKGANLTITADAHEAKALIFGYDECARRAQQAGCKNMFVFTKQGFVAF